MRFCIYLLRVSLINDSAGLIAYKLLSWSRFPKPALLKELQGVCEVMKSNNYNQIIKMANKTVCLTIWLHFYLTPGKN